MPLHNVVIPIKSVLNKGKTHYYYKTFEVKDGDKDKNNKLMPFLINDDKLLQKLKLFGLRLKIQKYIEWNALPVYNDR